MTLSVLLADDQEIVRTGLEMILNAQEGIEVIATASNGTEALEKALSLKPDVCLLDIRMPGLDGIEVTQRLAGPEAANPMAVVIITTFDRDEYVFGALRAGAKGFLLKDAGPALLAQAIRSAAEGDALIAPRVTTRLISTFAGRDTKFERPEPSSPLTVREEEVLLAVSQGLTNTEIGSKLHISLSTVKTHLASLMAKLNARNRVEVAIWAYETGRVQAR